MGPLPYQPLFLSFFTESGYLDSNRLTSHKQHRKALHTAPGASASQGRALSALLRALRAVHALHVLPLRTLPGPPR